MQHTELMRSIMDQINGVAKEQSVEAPAAKTSGSGVTLTESTAPAMKKWKVSYSCKSSLKEGVSNGTLTLTASIKRLAESIALADAAKKGRTEVKIKSIQQL